MHGDGVSDRESQEVRKDTVSRGIGLIVNHICNQYPLLYDILFVLFPYFYSSIEKDQEWFQEEHVKYIEMLKINTDFYCGDTIEEYVNHANLLHRSTRI